MRRPHTKEQVPALEPPAFKALTLFPEQVLSLRVPVRCIHCSGPVHVSLDGLPAGVTAKTIEPGTETSGARLELRVAANATTVTRTVTLVVRGPHGLSAESPLTLTITPPLPERLQNSIGMELVRFPAGQFIMGSPPTETGRGTDEDQAAGFIHAPFFMGIHEVTQEQYRKVLGEKPSHFKGDRLPVENVTWHDACRFCARLSEQEKKQGHKYRLPWEAEWEYVCRFGAAPGPFYLGDSLWSELANFDGRYPYGTGRPGRFAGHTTEVGSYQKASDFGLHDLCGNVGEWCQDWYFPRASPKAWKRRQGPSAWCAAAVGPSERQPAAAPPATRNCPTKPHQSPGSAWS